MTDFAKDIQERKKSAETADKDNRDEALLDLKFEAGEHWDDRVKQYREELGIAQYGFPLPCLTIHTVPQFINQVVGDRMANPAAIKVLPREDGDKDIAEIRGELIRSIELQSRAEMVYAQTFGQAVSCGIGNFRIDLDYAREDAFDRDLFIRSIPNPLAVLWDPFAADPTGRDATYCFVTDKVQREVYKERFKDATETSFETLSNEAPDWIDSDTVTIAEYWEIFEKKRTFALMNDGRVLDVTEAKKELWLPNAFVGTDGQPRVREAPCKYARMTTTNGLEPLDDPFEIKLYRLPIVRVTGREVWVGEKRVRYGLTRWMRDPARLKDYFRSVRAELLMSAPRHNYIAEAAAIEGRSKDWKNTLVYNTGKTPPLPATRDNLTALLTEEQFFSQDLKEVTGIHEAELGMNGNEKSGIAIQRRQQQGDIATIAYSQNMNASQQEAGEILNCLIPIAYDTARTIRTVGADDAVKVLRINDPNDPESKDLGIGRYDVTISTGPSYATQRQEQAAQLMELASRNPKFAEVVPDYIVEALDVKNADKMAERFKRTIPPELLGDEKDDDKSPEEIAESQQKAAEAQQLQQQMQSLQLREMEAKVVEAEAKAAKAQKEADDALKGINKQTVDAKNAETARLKAVTAKDFPLPPEAVAILAPLVTSAVIEALQSPDILPLELHASIAEAAFDNAEDERVRASMPPEMPENPEGVPQ